MPHVILQHSLVRCFFVRSCVRSVLLTLEEQATLRRLPQARSLDKAHFKLAISMLGSDASYDMV